MTWLQKMREIGAAFGPLSNDEFRECFENLCRERNVGSEERKSLITSFTFLADWWQNGSQVYEIQHSIAALLTATRAPDIDWERLPHRFFAIKVPAVFTPASHGEADTVISVHGPLSSVGLGGAKTIQWLTVNLDTWNEDIGDQAPSPEEQRQWRIIIRLVANTIAFINTHRECVSHGITRDRKPTGVATISAPKDVVIDRDFRDQVARLVSSGSLREVRRALAHVVRGHWRNQAVGIGHSERRLTWVRPHKRGDESLGRVVQRIERITKDS